MISLLSKKITDVLFPEKEGGTSTFTEGGRKIMGTSPNPMNYNGKRVAFSIGAENKYAKVVESRLENAKISFETVESSVGFGFDGEKQIGFVLPSKEVDFIEYEDLDKF